MNIYQSLNAIMAQLGAIGKDKHNPQQGYKFRGIDDMYNALHPLFKANKVFITSSVLDSRREERTTTRGGALIYTIARCCFRFHAEDGSFVESILEGEAMDSGDKSTNKAMSAALKYALMQMFLIPTEEKLDTEYETHEVAAKPKPMPDKWKAPTNDIDLMEQMLAEATTAEHIDKLRSFIGINRNFFSTNAEMHQAFIKKGMALKAQFQAEPATV